MQHFELATLALFLLSYLFSGLRAIIAPSVYREAEVQFYTTGKARSAELLVFGLGAASFVTLVLHFILESPRIGELLLYGQVILFAIMLPLHFMPFLRARMKSTLSRKSDADYRSSGWRKLAVGVVMIVLPLAISR